MSGPCKPPYQARHAQTRYLVYCVSCQTHLDIITRDVLAEDQDVQILCDQCNAEVPAKVVRLGKVWRVGDP